MEFVGQALGLYKSDSIRPVLNAALLTGESTGVSSDCRPDEENLIAASFTAARRLVGNHVGQVLRITNAQQIEERHLMAAKIVENLSNASAPLKLRDIVRCFKFQRIDRFNRVMESLIETDVLIRDEDGCHTIGSVDLEDVAEILDQKFMLP